MGIELCVDLLSIGAPLHTSVWRKPEFDNQEL